MRAILGFVVLGLLMAGAGCGLYGIGASDATMFTATLSGDAERPEVVVTDGTGNGMFSLNADETQLAYEISAMGLSGDVIAAHFHFSASGAEGFGDVVFDISDSIVNDGAGGVSAEGTWDVSTADVSNLRLNYIYVNLHTDANPAGEIRGNLVPAP